MELYQMGGISERDGTSYRHRIGSSQLLLQTVNVSLGYARLVRVVEADNTTESQEGNNKHSQVEKALPRSDVGILFRAEDTEDLVLFMDRLAEVALLLLVPPATVRISELALHAGRVLVAAILSCR